MDSETSPTRKMPGYAVLPLETARQALTPIMLGRRMTLREVAKSPRLLLRLLPKLLKWMPVAMWQRLRGEKGPSATPSRDTFLPRAEERY